MSLNLYKNEVRDFLLRMGSLNGDNQEKITWLNEEFDLLKDAVYESNTANIRFMICYICCLK